MTTMWEQIWAFVITLLVGMAVGLFYDFYFVLRNNHRLRQTATLIGDLVFWLGATVIAFAGLLLGTNGEVRLYIFVAMLLGYGIYRKMLSPFSRRIIKKTDLWLYRQFGRLLKFISKPFRIIGKRIKFPKQLTIKVKKILQRLAGKFRRM